MPGNRWRAFCPGSDLWLVCLAFGAMGTAYLVVPGAALAAGFVPGSVGCAAASALGIVLGMVILFAGAYRVTGSRHGALVLWQLDKAPVRGVWRALWLAPVLLLSAGIITGLWMLGGKYLGIEFTVPPATRALTSGMPGAKLLGAAAVVLAPVFEEMVFRRAIYGALAGKCSAVWATALTALAFSAMHLSFLQLPGLWWIAWNWQHTVRKDNSLWSSIWCHALNNLIAVGLVFLIGGDVGNMDLQI